MFFFFFLVSLRNRWAWMIFSLQRFTDTNKAMLDCKIVAILLMICSSFSIQSKMKRFLLSLLVIKIILYSTKVLKVFRTGKNAKRNSLNMELLLSLSYVQLVMVLHIIMLVGIWLSRIFMKCPRVFTSKRERSSFPFSGGPVEPKWLWKNTVAPFNRLS